LTNHRQGTENFEEQAISRPTKNDENRLKMAVQETSTTSDNLPQSIGIDGVRVSGRKLDTISLTCREAMEGQVSSKQKPSPPLFVFQKNPKEQAA
jgi:hypothetical protein